MGGWLLLRGAHRVTVLVSSGVCSFLQSLESCCLYMGSDCCQKLASHGCRAETDISSLTVRGEWLLLLCPSVSPSFSQPGWRVSLMWDSHHSFNLPLNFLLQPPWKTLLLQNGYCLFGFLFQGYLMRSYNHIWQILLIKRCNDILGVA